MSETQMPNDAAGFRRFKRYPAYRESGVERLAKIPELWCVLKLKRVCKFAYGDSLATDIRQDGEVEVYGSNGPVGTHDSANTFGPCLVIGRKGSFGKVNFSTQPVFAIDTTFFVDRRCTGADIRWLYYVLSDARLDSATKDSAIPGLDREDAYTQDVSSCSEEEQRAIAAFLDRATAKIDALVAKKERLIELLQEKRNALTTQAVTRGLDPNVPMKDSGVEWLGAIPVHWEVKAMNQSLLRITYGFTNPMPLADDGPYLLTAFDIGDGEILYANARRTTEEAFSRLLTDKSRPRAGDILITKDGTLGRVAIAGGERTCINQSVALLRFDPRKVDINFLHHALRATPYQDRMIFEAGGTAIKHIYVSRLAKMPIALPPIQQQQEISDFITSHFASIDSLVSKVVDAIDYFRELRTALISAAVTGKIDVREEVA
jgi:type I restriction enzyme, S subunit